MLTHLRPQESKNGSSSKHCKTQDILATRGGRRQGRRPLSPLERREGLRQGHGQLRPDLFKTKLVCETSSVFELDITKNAAIQRDFRNFCIWQHQKRNNSARLPHFSKLTTSKTKQFWRHLSRKIISANLKIWCSKMQPLSGNQRPDLLTSLMNMSLVLRLPRKMHLCRSSSNVPRLPSFL